MLASTVHWAGCRHARPSATGGAVPTDKNTWKRTLSEFLYGVTSYEFAQQTVELRASMETMFMLVSFGDMIGVPILPPYYGLRLLPYVVPGIQTWKRRLLREHELGDSHEYHLHGL
jgi:hypothetical protein